MCLPDRTLQKAESYANHAKSVAQNPELYDPETVRRIRSGEERLGCGIHRAASRIGSGKAEDQVDLCGCGCARNADNSDGRLPRLQNSRRVRTRCVRQNSSCCRNTRPFNVWGLPAISVPCGFTQSGLPIGLQIAAPPWREDMVLQLAYAYEQATAWHKRECDVPSIRRG